MRISFVIPCYRSELTIKNVISEIHEVMSQRADTDHEIITVNDCSPDNVLEVLKELAAKDRRLKVIDLAKNSGKHAAMMAGYRYVSGDVIVNLDDDGQCPMDKLWELTAPLEKGYDIVVAKYPKKKESAFKRFGSKVNAVMAQYLIGKPKTFSFSNFSAMKRFVVDEIKKYDKPYPYISGLMLRASSKICNVEMEERDRLEGTGSFTFTRSLKLWLNGFTAFSVKPLRVSTVMGVICAIAGAVFGIVTVIHKIIDPATLMGYSSTMAVLLFIGGMIMMMLGMIGEYIGRIYICINNSPQYVIRETFNAADETDDTKQNGET